jgi:hypothetical protein
MIVIDYQLDFAALTPAFGVDGVRRQLRVPADRLADDRVSFLTA